MATVYKHNSNLHKRPFNDGRVIPTVRGLHNLPLRLLNLFFQTVGSTPFRHGVVIQNVPVYFVSSSTQAHRKLILNFDNNYK